MLLLKPREKDEVLGDRIPARSADHAGFFPARGPTTCRTRSPLVSWGGRWFRTRGRRRAEIGRFPRALPSACWRMNLRAEEGDSRPNDHDRKAAELALKIKRPAAPPGMPAR